MWFGNIPTTLPCLHCKTEVTMSRNQVAAILRYVSSSAGLLALVLESLP